MDDRMAALRAHAILLHKFGKSTEALADLTTLIEYTGAPKNAVASALAPSAARST